MQNPSMGLFFFNLSIPDGAVLTELLERYESGTCLFGSYSDNFKRNQNSKKEKKNTIVKHVKLVYLKEVHVQRIPQFFFYLCFVI